MSKPVEGIVDLSKKLMSLRQNPVLVLDLKEVEKKNSLTLQRKLFGKKFKTLDVILQTPGGDIDAAFNITKLIRYSASTVNMIVPLFAKSAGTLMCLGGNSILLTTLSELGPLDTQIREEQDGTSPTYAYALNGFKALEQVQLHTIETLDIATKLIFQRSGMKIAEAIKLAADFSGNTSGTLYHQLDPKKIGEYARALEIGERYGIMILTRYMGWAEEKADPVVKKLVKWYPNHGFAIDAEELTSLGLPARMVSNEEEALLDELRLALLQSKGTLVELIELPVHTAPKAKVNTAKKLGNPKGNKNAKDAQKTE